MQEYAPARLLAAGGPPQSIRPTAAAVLREGTGFASEGAALDQVLVQLADLVADRLIEGAQTAAETSTDWMDARAAANHLGMHRDTLRKLAAERAVPVHQDGPGCKLYFRRAELDDWRRAGRAPRSCLRAVA